MLIHSGCKDTRAVVEPDLWVKNRKTGLRSKIAIWWWMSSYNDFNSNQFHLHRLPAVAFLWVWLKLFWDLTEWQVDAVASQLDLNGLGLSRDKDLLGLAWKVQLYLLMWNRWQLQLATTKILIVVIEMWDKKVASNSDIKWAQNWAASHVLSSSWEDLVLQQPLTGRLGEQVLLETFICF